MGGGGCGESVQGGWIYCKYCVYMYVNEKIIPVETIPGMAEGEDKGEWWREWIKYDIFVIL
jgi:hypothetical protein